MSYKLHSPYDPGSVIEHYGFLEVIVDKLADDLPTSFEFTLDEASGAELEMILRTLEAFAMSRKDKDGVCQLEQNADKLGKGLVNLLVSCQHGAGQKDVAMASTGESLDTGYVQARQPMMTDN